MNRIYRLVFNRALGQVQAVAEVASRRRGAAAAGGRAGAPGKSVLCAALLAAAGQAAAQAPGALDLPTGGKIVGGSASITPGHGSLEIVQNGRTVIDWNTFDIGSDARVKFSQSGGSVALNRILDGDASQILGRLDADATIFLINPNGLLFGEGAQVNVGGLVASTLSPVAAYPGAPDPIQDFLQGSPSLTLAIGSNAQGAIVNRGALRGGQIALVGGYVENAAGATIQADGGRAGLYAADGVQLTLGWGSVSGVTIQQAVQNALQATLVNNLGRIQAVGGSAILGARGRVGTVSAAINTEGVIEASDIALTGSGGQLRAGGDIAAATSLSLSSGDAQAYLDGDIEAGSLSLYARDIQQGGGALAVRGTAVLEASQDIDLSGAGNDFGGRVDVAGRNVDLVSGSDLRIGDLDVRGNLAVDSLGAVSFAGGTVGGALDVEAAGIAQTGALSVRDGSAFDAGSHDIDLRHAGNAFGGDVDIVAQDASLGSSTGLRFGSLDARGNLTVASQGGVSFAGGTVGGALEVVAGGSIGQTGALTVRGAAAFDAGSHGILLNQAGNDFVGTVDILGAGVVVMADANALTFGQVDAAVLDVASGGDLTFGATTLSGALAARSAGGGIRQDGAASIGGEISLSAGEIAFDHADNRLQGPVWLSGGNVRIRDRTALRFGAVDVGSLQATAPELWLAADMRSDGLQVYVGDVRLAQDTRIASTLGDVDIRGTLDGAHALEVAAAGNVFFRTAVGATAALERLDVGAGRIHLGGDVATRGDQIYRSAVSLGGNVALASADGGIAFQSTVDGAHALSARAADVAFGGAIGSASAGALAALTVDSGTFAAAGSVAVAGDLRLTVAQGGIGQAAAWTIGGASALDAGGGDIVLTQAGNDFRDTVDLAGDAVRIHDANALTLGRLATGALTASSGGALGLGQGLVGGALSATSAAGGIGQSGALTVTGDAALDAGSGDILLTQAGNDFATVSVAGIDARLSDDNEIRLTGIDATDLHVRAQTIRLDLDTVATGGDQTYAGRLVLERDTALSSDAGSLSFQAVDGSAQRMTARAAQGAVDFGGAVQLRELDAASATFRAGGPLATAGALAIATTAGGIGQNGAWTVGGSADLRASGGIALRDGGNDFSGPVRLESGQGVALHDAGDLTIASLATGAGHGVHLEAGGALALPAQAIDTGDGALTLVAGGTLATAGTLSGGALTLHGAGGVVLAHDVAAGDELTLSSTHGDVAQTGGRIHAGGTTTAEAGGDIRLAAEGNDFVGAVQLRGGAAAIRDANALTLGAIDVAALSATAGDALELGAGRIGGALSATSERGGIGQSGALAVGGDLALDAAGDVTLLADNAFAGTVDVRGQAVSLRSDTLRLDEVQADRLLARGARIELGQDIATRGAQAYEGALALGADRALSSEDADLRFVGTVTGAHALSAEAGGTVSFADAIDVAALRVDANAFSAASTLAAQDLRIAVAEGGIGQAAAWRVSGTTTLDAGAGDIALDHAGNDFAGAVQLRGGEAAIRDANALTLGAIDVAALSATAGDALELGAGRVGGALSATSERGGIGQSGALAVGGDLALDAAGDVTLLADNAFAGTVDVRGQAVSLRSDTLRLDEVQADRLLARGARIELGQDIATRGAQAYEGALALGADRALSSAESDLRFAGTVTGAHALSAEAGGTVSFADAIDVAALRVDANAFSAASTLAAQDLRIAVAEGGIAQAAAWRVSGTTTLDAGAGDIALDHAGNDFAGAVQLRGGAAAIRDANALTLGAIDVAALSATAGDALELGAGRVGGALSATSERGGIGQSGALAVGGDLALDAAGDVTLLADNVFAGTVDVRGQAVSLRSDTLRLDEVQADRLLARGARIELGQDVATRGAQTYEGALALGADRALSSAESDLRFAGTVTGAHALSAEAGGTVSFADAIDVAALRVDANAFSAASTLAAQDLRIAVAEGGIAQSAAWRVSGTTTLDAGAGDIALDHAGNDFAGAVHLRGGAVAVRDANDLAVASLASGPDRDVSLVAGGTLSLPAQAIDTGSGALRLASQGGALATAGALAGGDVTLTGRDGLALGHDVDARGALSLAARDAAIAQDGGRIVAAGRTTVDAGAGEATLAQAGNDFAGPVDLRAGSVSIRDANALSLGAVDVAGALAVVAAGELGLGAGRIGGALTASSGGGAIGQSGALSVGGDAALDAGGGAIALDQAGNDFAGTVHLAGGAAAIRDANALALGTLAVDGLRVASGGALALGEGRIGGELDARAGGGIGQSGALAVAGASRIDAGAGDIVLDHAGNDFAGAVSLAGGAVSVRDAGDLVVAGLASGADRDVRLVAGGTLSLPAQTIETGAGALRLASLGGRLDTAGALRGAEVSLAGAAGLGLGHDVEADGTLSLSSGGDIAQTGGALAAGTLTGDSVGSTRLGGANRIGTLGAYAAQDLELAVAGPLRIAGPVEGGARAMLTVAGDLTIEGRLAATDVRLEAGGGIAGGAGGAIDARTLSGQAGGAVALGDGGWFMDNQVDALGDFVARAGFSLTNGRSLTLTSLGGSAYTVDAGTAATYLRVEGDLLQSGETFLRNGAGTWAASGRIGAQDAPIRVVGVDPQRVEAIGLPPAYFYAVRADGSVLPVIGAFAVNVPASIWAGRIQSSSRRDVGYVDVGADASNYRPYGVIGAGIRLPEDQQPECDPDFPAPECLQAP